MSRGFPILFITATRIGDAVLSSGLIKRLADEIPNARFTIVAGPVAEQDSPPTLIELPKPGGGAIEIVPLALVSPYAKPPVP